LRVVRRDDAIGVLGLDRHVLRQVGLLDLGLLLGKLRRGLRRIGVRTRRQVLFLDLGRGHLHRELGGIGAQAVADVVAAQIR
jgi:hypothetical protein